MEYVREHIKKYWVFAYRRTLGISLVTFAVSFSIGITFTSLLSNLLVGDYLIEFTFWGILILVTTAVLVSSFVDAHKSTIRFMNEEEHMRHYKHMGLWMLSLVMGVSVFVAPLFFFSSDLEPLALLFTFGGIFWILYLSVIILFKQRFNEIAIGATMLWVVFFIGISGIGNSKLGSAANIQFGTFVSLVSLISISSITGLALITNSSRELLKEFREMIGRTNRGKIGKARRRR